MAQLLRERADARPDEVAVRLRECGGWTEWSWSQYWQAAAAAAAVLRESGVEPGDHVLVLVPEMRQAVTCLFGLWVLGAVPVHIAAPPAPPVPPVQDRAAFLAGLIETGRLLDARTAILPASLAAIAAMAPPGRLRWLEADAVARGEPAAPLGEAAAAGRTAFIQLTSGTTAQPRGVVVTHERLMLHMEAMSSRLPSHSESAGVSWLPLYHDMGLVGGLLFPFYNGFPGHMISTGEFQRQPWVWLDAMSRFRATITAAPPSAYAVCTQLAPRLAAGGLDLSAWECAMVGAEPISAQMLRRFAAAFGPAGFRSEAFFPVYGLAEATVAVTFPDLLAPARIDRIDRRALERDGRAVPADIAHISNTGGDSIEFVSVGRAIARTEIRIVRMDGGIAGTAAERSVGEIQVRSDTLMAGYYGDPGATADAVAGGWLRTGDLGYEAGGLLFVTGRRKEIIIRGGQNLVPSVLEEIAASVEGVRPGAVAAVGVRLESRETELVCVVAETRLDALRHREVAARIRSALRARGMTPDRVVLVPPRSLPRTTSGKIRRLELARRLAAGGAQALS